MRTIRCGIAALAMIAVAGCAVVRNQSTPGEYVDDVVLVTQIKARFAEDPVVSAAALEVEALRGTVQLTGFARSQDEKARAGELARQVTGVREVRNDIIVRP